jgi:L-serine dehydratase
MAKYPASIFNDVIGPVMRGPSSSHVAAAHRIGSIVRQSLPGSPVRAVVDFDVSGSLAATHKGHGTDFGFAGGLMGIPLTDPRVADACGIAARSGMDLRFRILDYGATHPSHYRIEAQDDRGVLRCWDAVSIGGGMMEMLRLDGRAVSVTGDFFEVLAFVADESARGRVRSMLGGEIASEDGPLVQVRLANPPSEDALAAVRSFPGTGDVIMLTPVLPTRTALNCRVPFTTAEGLLRYARAHSLSLSACALAYESARGGMPEAAVREKIVELVGVMREGVRRGLQGTAYKDRILGPQASGYVDRSRQGALAPLGALDTVIPYVTALMETKSAMEVIVAAPTVGACGCLPGTILGFADAAGLGEEAVIRGMLAAGAVGVLIAEGATFSAEIAGCQAECGAGSSMAAAGVVEMLGGGVETCLDAAAIAMQNITGLACDPVADRTEVPCLGKNVLGGANALASANMALAGYDKVIPLDETIGAMARAGALMPPQLRCTLGGLGDTPTAHNLYRRLNREDEKGGTPHADV